MQALHRLHLVEQRRPDLGRVFAVAKHPKSSTLEESAYTTARGLAVQTGGPQFSSRFDRPIPGVHSDHPRMHYPPKKLAKKKAFEND